MGSKSSKVAVYVLKVKNDDEISHKKTVLSHPTKKNSALKNVITTPAPSKQEHATTIDRMRSSPNLSRQRSTLASPKSNSVRRSISSMDVSSSSKINSQMTNPSCPWLLKNKKFIGASINDFEIGRIIGRGLMGTVRIVKTKDNKYLVLKIIRKDYIVRHNDQRHIQNEKEVLSLMKCHFCVKLFGTFRDKINCYFALEYLPGGELFHWLGKKKFFEPAVAKFYVSEIFIALEHVQSLGYVYRDLKPENILLDEEGHCKLVDFGFTTRTESDGKMHTLCGTPAYLSPEQLDGKLTNGYTKVVDWWSYGVLLYELLTGKTPFCHHPKDSHYEIFLRILKNRISYPISMDKDSKDLIGSLCHAQIPKRLSDPDLIKIHKYYEIPWNSVRDRQLVPPYKPNVQTEGDDHYFDIHPEYNTTTANDGKDNNHESKHSADFTDF